MVDLKVIGVSPEASFNCAKGVFTLIKTSQAQIIEPYIEEAKLNLLDNQERLAEVKGLVMNAAKSRSDMGATYLSVRDEIRFHLDEIAALRNLVTSYEKMETRLVAPIYKSDVAITPKKHNILQAGLFAGIFLGLLIAVGRQLIASRKALLEKNALPM